MAPCVDWRQCAGAAVHRKGWGQPHILDNKHCLHVWTTCEREWWKVEAAGDFKTVIMLTFAPQLTHRSVSILGILLAQGVSAQPSQNFGLIKAYADLCKSRLKA